MSTVWHTDAQREEAIRVLRSEGYTVTPPREVTLEEAMGEAVAARSSMDMAEALEKLRSIHPGAASLAPSHLLRRIHEELGPMVEAFVVREDPMTLHKRAIFLVFMTMSLVTSLAVGTPAHARQVGREVGPLRQDLGL